MKEAIVYLFKRNRPVLDMDPKWGTLDAISAVEGSIPITRSGRRVSADLLDADGFIPYGLSPDDLLDS
jgi:hypothetical protein